MDSAPQPGIVELPPLGPEPILRLATLVSQTEVLHTARELEVFGALAEGSLTEPELREQLGLHERYSKDFLDALVGLGLLVRAGVRYRNSPVAGHYLVPGQDVYLGDYPGMVTASFQQAWGQLIKGLRTGEVETQPRGGFVAKSHEDKARFKAYADVMDHLSTRVGREFAERFDWSAFKNVGDLGGARGHLTAVLLEAHPHLSGYCFEPPSAQRFLEEHMAELGQAGRVEFVGGDLFTDPIPEADVLIYGQVLHGWEDEERRTLVRRAYEALRPGGMLLVYDRMIDEERRDPQRLLYSLYMRLVSPMGSEYRAVDCAGWLREAGFSEVWAEPLLNTHTVVVGRK
ncbi:methyltransferase [Streptomyces winkii]|uniref:methyltransferase n=1 Tax=Streptomyces winkii TaxID=3051178 RepID=UPI0028D4591A|nr:methyltransferase [Streptomyces sp. DSM 40971]